MIDLEKQGEVHVLRMEAGENRFSPAVLEGLTRALDELEKADGPKALVSVGSGKFYSNGLDLDWMTGEGRADSGGYLAAVLDVIARVLTFPAVTVAAVNGHAFGAGAQLVLAHDYRVMRADRGFFCMPEIDMRAPLHPGMTAIIQARLPVHAAHECIVTGRRYGGVEAREVGIVDEALPEDEVLDVAVARAAALAAKAHPVMRTLKRGLYAEVLAAMAIPLSAALADDPS